MSDHLERRLRSTLSAYRDQVVADDALLVPRALLPQPDHFPAPAPRWQPLVAAIVVALVVTAGLVAALSSDEGDGGVGVAVGGGTATAAQFDRAAAEVCALIDRGVDVQPQFATVQAYSLAAAARRDLVTEVSTALASLPRPADPRRQAAAARSAATLLTADRTYELVADVAGAGEIERAAASLASGDQRLFRAAGVLSVDDVGRCADVGRR